ncbi:MAG: hypothetical protein KJ057_09510 [Phycisphaerae bacterium]|nr:hypothetical protein [Planctomycetia bacterium]MCK6466094.1 hypothetical protein [Phycisphaerae bacterium]MCL4718695.1 hypothetical protein [Phycisphaerae bacterium]NUQ10071.1 hypothetical protein [Phycisphaerae bacterium]
MPVSDEEFDHLVARASGDETLRAMTLCGGCLYDLRGLPAAGRCPECGGRYCAAGLRRRGVFRPEHAEFPLAELSASLVLLLICGWIFDPYALIVFGRTALHVAFGFLTGLTGLLCTLMTYARIRRYVRARWRLRQAQAYARSLVPKEEPWVVAPRP